MSMTLGARKDATAETNVTPLIDVLLVLLIIFMVVLPHHRRGEYAGIPLPNHDQTLPNPEDVIVIQLQDGGAGKPPGLEINHDRVAWDALETRLKEICQLRMDKVAFLKGDPEIDFQYVADALDIAHRAGVNRVGLMDAQPEAAGAADLAALKR